MKDFRFANVRLLSAMLASIMMLYFFVAPILRAHFFSDNVAQSCPEAVQPRSIVGRDPVWDKNFIKKATYRYLGKARQWDMLPYQSNIVMLGDSLTAGGYWRGLLKRNDIVNFGLDGDTLGGSACHIGILSRLQGVYNVHPKRVYIMAGINDILAGEPNDYIAARYHELLKTLISKNITPIVFSTLYVAENFANKTQYRAYRVNHQVSTLNQQLKIICQRNHISFIDLNTGLSSAQKLNTHFTSDGIHLNSDGYQQWAKLMHTNISNSTK